MGRTDDVCRSVSLVGVGNLETSKYAHIQINDLFEIFLEEINVLKMGLWREMR